MMRSFGKSSNEEEAAAAAATAPGNGRFPSIRLALLGLGSYAAVLAATIPVRLAVDEEALPPAVTGLSGTLWNGEAAVAGGHRAGWHVSVLDSLVNFGLAVNWSLTGDGTDLTGEAVISRSTADLSDIDGRIGWPLVEAFAPGLAAICDLSVRIDIAALALGAGAQTVDGTVRAPASTCTFKEGGVTRQAQLPALVATAAAGDPLRLVEAGDPSRAWAEVQLLPDRRIALTWHPTAVAFMSGAQASGPIMLEFGF